ncbi:MAG: YvcK family protein [Candidatus Magasanikbacteria bacterium]|nr:YvcK family protein [Candidatus Magasanikbacteria bacterium]
MKIVTIGGGNGQSVTLRALKKFLPQVQITSIVSVTDSGGSSGRLREQFNILSVGDILRVILALSSYNYLDLREIFYNNRFTEGELEGHNAGNLLLTFLYQQSGSWLKAIEGFSEILKIQGRVLPVTLDLVHLCAQLENGEIITGETNIDIPTFDCKIRKEKLWLEPKALILPEANEAILQADYIFLGSGDLYTSIIPGLLVGGIQEALFKTKAKIVFIPNVANREKGETCGFNVSDYVSEIHNYLPRPVDYIIAHDSSFKLNLEHFAVKNWEPVEVDDGVWQKNHQVVFADLCADTEAGMDWAKLVAPVGKVLKLV